VAKRTLFFSLLLVITITLMIFVLPNIFKTKLISPFFQGPDQTEKISQRITAPLVLDLTKVKTLSSLNNIPRYLVYNNETGKVYYAKGTDTRMSPASFTKLLSSQVALDLVPKEYLITATKDSVAKVPTILGLKVGEKLSVADLLRGAIATSANDAAQTLADGAAGAVGINTTEFIYYMNAKALLLGLNNSHFTNPDGLDDQNQYSTLQDLAKLVNNVQKNYPEILEAAISDNLDIQKTVDHDFYYLPNWNGLLGVYPGTTGLKIAYTEDAGYSTIVIAKRENFSMVAIVSGANSYLERDLAAADLLDAGFLALGLEPVSLNKNQLNLHYKEWGDLARKIQAGQKALESNQ
jgi:D-alanyl-D-alanine carboxypeptidase (penicillin-binding protein 5/6)